MLNAHTFQKKADALAFLLFFIGIFILFFCKWLPIWAAFSASAFVAVTIRQFMVGRILDIFASLVFFGALFFFNSYYYSELWTGIVMIVGSGYAFVRLCFDIYTINLQDKESFAFKKFLRREEEQEDEDPKN